MAGLEDIVSDLKHRVAHYEKRLKSRPLLEKRRAFEALASLPQVSSFPEGGIERYELLRKQLRNLLGERDVMRREMEQRRYKRRELLPMADPDELARRTHVIDTLRKLVPRMDAARRVYRPR